jgi:ribosome-associated protein
MLIVNHRICIPDSELHLSFARSGGPGGQNVNKVSSKAILEWAVMESTALPEDVRERFLSRYRNRITRDGRLQIIGQRYREQAKNIEDCRGRLAAMLLSVSTAPVQRKQTSPSRGAKQRRLTDKRQRSDTKQARRRPVQGD